MINSRSSSLKSKLRTLFKVKPWRETERNEVHKALRKAKGDKLLAATLLGISKTTLYRKLEQLER